LSIRFQADADLNPEIGRGLRRREPAIDFRGATGVIPEGEGLLIVWLTWMPEDLRKSSAVDSVGGTGRCGFPVAKHRQECLCHPLASTIKWC